MLVLFVALSAVNAEDVFKNNDLIWNVGGTYR